MKRVRLSPERVGRILSEPGWGSAGAVAIVTTAAIILFGTGP